MKWLTSCPGVWRSSVASCRWCPLDNDDGDEEGSVTGVLQNLPLGICLKWMFKIMKHGKTNQIYWRKYQRYRTLHQQKQTASKLTINYIFRRKYPKIWQHDEPTAVHTSRQGRWPPSSPTGCGCPWVVPGRTRSRPWWQSRWRSLPMPESCRSAHTPFQWACTTPTDDKTVISWL